MAKIHLDHSDGSYFTRHLTDEDRVNYMGSQNPPEPNPNVPAPLVFP
jgi:hypothetical protein